MNFIFNQNMRDIFFRVLFNYATINDMYRTIKLRYNDYKWVNHVGSVTFAWKIAKIHAITAMSQ
jgi:hypothetical protein